MSDTRPASPWLFAIAAACIGAGLGLVGYRFGVLPLGWRSSASWLFPGLAAGIAMGGRQLVRGRSGRPGVPVLGLAGLVGAGAAFGLAFLVVPPLGHARLSTRALPGFTIDLPSGEVASEVAEYHAGKLLLKGVAGTGSVVGLQWESGEASREDLELAARALAPGIGATAPPRELTVSGPGGTQVPTFVIASGKGPFWMSMVTCGRRRIVIQTMGSDATERLHRRIVPTIACRPDPAQETATTEVPVIVELPGWQATDRQPNQVTLTDGAAVLMLRRGTFRADELDRLVPPVFSALGARVTLEPPIGDRISFTATIDGDVLAGFARVLPCDRFSVLMIAFADDRATVERVATQTSTARCARPGEPLPVWPDAPAAE